jgi:ATP-dependent 26S proteasome regulatory subunit
LPFYYRIEHHICFENHFPFGQESARAEIMRIHSRKMTVDLDDVNFEELARCTEDFNGAQMKAVCVESGNRQKTETKAKQGKIR